MLPENIPVLFPSEKDNCMRSRDYSALKLHQHHRGVVRQLDLLHGQVRLIGEAVLVKQFLELTAGGAGAVDAALVVNGQDLRQGLSAGRHHRVAAGLDLHALADAGGGGVYQLAIRLYDADAI